MNLEKWVRPNILAMKAYSSARSEFKGKGSIFLDANENPFDNGLNRYPDPLQWQVKKHIAHIKKVDKEQIFLGNGSDEAIDLIIRIFCEPRIDNILTLPPTYGMYQVSAATSDIEVLKVPLTLDFQLDVPAILAAITPQTKVLFICTPNNPTANNINWDDIKTILNNFEGIVVVDEAYIDFAGRPSCTTLLSEYPNLIVLQTFSKAWGMAGIRLGMAFSNPEIIALFNKVKPPYNVNQLTQQVALKTLQESDLVQQRVATILKERSQLATALSTHPLIEKVFESDANFILARVKDANTVYKALVEKGIIVRNRSTVLNCESTLRFTVGTPEENEALITALNDFIS